MTSDHRCTLAAAGEPDIVEKVKKGHQAGAKTFKVHLDGYNLIPFLTGEMKENPRPGFLYWSEGDLMALRYGDWKFHFMGPSIGRLSKPILLEEAKAAGKQSVPKPAAATPACGRRKTIGQWKTAWTRFTNSTRLGRMHSWRRERGIYGSGVMLANAT